MSQTYFLERIYLPTKTVYREVRYVGEDFEVKEYDTLPDWYVRELKLQMILDEEDTKLG